MKPRSVTLTPAARLGWLNARSDAFVETGVVAPIAYRSRSLSALLGGVELKAAVDLAAAPGRRVTAHALIGYEDFLSVSSGAVKGKLAGNTAQPFSTTVGDLRGEGLILGAGLTGEIGAARISADYRASLGKGDGVRHRASLGARFGF